MHSLTKVDLIRPKTAPTAISWRYIPLARGSRFLSGSLRRNASLAILHRASFAAIPSVSEVRLGHANRNVSVSHESHCEIALV